MIRRGLILFAMVSIGATMVGCEKELFPQTAYRSPYDRYLMLRGQGRPATQQNALGGEEPALRERLRPLGE